MKRTKCSQKQNVLKSIYEKLNKKVIATSTMLMSLFIDTMQVFAEGSLSGSSSKIKEAMGGTAGSTDIWSSLKSFFDTALAGVDALIPIVGTLALLIGVVMAFVASPFKKYRGVGIGCIVFSMGVFALWIFAPSLIASLVSA